MKQILLLILSLFIASICSSQNHLDNLSIWFSPDMVQWRQWKDVLTVIKKKDDFIVAELVFTEGDVDKVTYFFEGGEMLCYTTHMKEVQHPDTLHKDYGPSIMTGDVYVWNSSDNKTYAYHKSGTRELIIVFDFGTKRSIRKDGEIHSQIEELRDKL